MEATETAGILATQVELGFLLRFAGFAAIWVGVGWLLGRRRGGTIDASQPLGLPQGSVRSILVLTITAGTIGIYLVYKWAPPELVALMTMTVRDYMAARAGQASPAAPSAEAPK